MANGVKDLVDEVDDRGKPITGRSVAVLFNASYEAVKFTLPKTRAGEFTGRVKIERIKTGTDIDVIFYFKIELTGFTPASDFDIIRLVFSLGY